MINRLDKITQGMDLDELELYLSERIGPLDYSVEIVFSTEHSFIVTTSGPNTEEGPPFVFMLAIAYARYWTVDQLQAEIERNLPVGE